MDQQQHHFTNESAIFSLWLSWTISVGALILPILLALVVPKIWMPLIVLGIMGALILYRNTGGRNAVYSCDLIQAIAVRTLGISALIMLVIAIIYVRGYISMFFEPSEINTDIPFLSVLIIAPVAALNCIGHLLLGRSASVCRACVIKNGPYSERGFLGKIFRQESNYQLRMLLIFMLVLTVVGWTYYALFYINVNLNRVDRFVLSWVPGILFGLTIIYLGMRYFSLWGYYYKHIESNPRKNATTSNIRYLVLCGDNIFLSRMGEFNEIPDTNKLDTPAELFLPTREKISIAEASRMFADLSNINREAFSMRFMYKNSDLSGFNNSYHFICCLNTLETIDDSFLKGKWYTLSQLQRHLANRDVDPMLAAEIHRLYTITMAWKTYDSEGRRLYKIKNYHPNFRLRGICDWDVDFNSSLWLEVARFNEDKPFYRLRKLLRRNSNQDEDAAN